MAREVWAETPPEGAESTEDLESTVDLEPITQGILTMRTVLSTAQREQQRQFFVGQWLDVKDTINQWLEATVMDIADGKVLVHYHGWIHIEADMTAAFRFLSEKMVDSPPLECDVKRSAQGVHE